MWLHCVLCGGGGATRLLVVAGKQVGMEITWPLESGPMAPAPWDRGTVGRPGGLWGVFPHLA